MKIVHYYDHDGSQISKQRWSELQAEPEYRIVREFDNGRVRVRLMWGGKVLNPQNTLSDYYPVLGLFVQNYDSAGKLRDDPVESGKTFPNVAAAVPAYEAFLERWTESHRVENGQTGEDEFVEVGNVLVPPPPPDKNVPVSEVPDDDGVGAW